MTNTNCLEGIACPQCGAEDAFYIEASILLLVNDDGTDDQDGNHIWDEDHPCRCAACGHHGRVSDFTIEKTPKPPAAPDLRAAAELVVARWERGDLAEAVRGLAAAVAQAKPERGFEECASADSIQLTWHIDDVAELRPDLTKAQCREVLQRALDRHDAGLGITWDILEIHADDLFPQKGGAP